MQQRRAKRNQWLWAELTSTLVLALPLAADWPHLPSRPRHGHICRHATCSEGVHVTYPQSSDVWIARGTVAHVTRQRSENRRGLLQNPLHPVVPHPTDRASAESVVAMVDDKEVLKAKLKQDPSFRKELKDKIKNALLAKVPAPASFTYNFDSYMVNDDSLQPGQIRLLDVDERLVLPTNTLVRLLVTASDVIHSWAVPSLGVKVDAVPGRLNQVWLTINRPGVFYGQCRCAWAPSAGCGEAGGRATVGESWLSRAGSGSAL